MTSWCIVSTLDSVQTTLKHHTVRALDRKKGPAMRRDDGIFGNLITQ